MPISTAQEIVVLKSPSIPADTRLDDFIELAKFHISENTFGDKYEYALALLVLHWLTLEAQTGGSSTSSGSGAVGGVSSKKEGQLSINFGGMPSGTSERRAYLMSTQFGQELLQIWNACIFTARNRFVNDA